MTAGFLVDSVSEIMKAQIDAIRPAPELSPDQMRMISRVINLEDEGRLILLVDPAQLLDQVEADVLAKFRSARTRPARERSVIKLLVVDNSALMRKVLEDIFLEEGDFEIRLARNGTRSP